MEKIKCPSFQEISFSEGWNEFFREIIFDCSYKMSAGTGKRLCDYNLGYDCALEIPKIIEDSNHNYRGLSEYFGLLNIQS